MGWLLTTFEKKWHKWAIGLGIALALVLTALVLVILFFENELHPHHTVSPLTPTPAYVAPPSHEDTQKTICYGYSDNGLRPTMEQCCDAEKNQSCTPVQAGTCQGHEYPLGTCNLGNCLCDNDEGCSAFGATCHGGICSAGILDGEAGTDQVTGVDFKTLIWSHDSSDCPEPAWELSIPIVGKGGSFSAYEEKGHDEKEEYCYAHFVEESEESEKSETRSIIFKKSDSLENDCDLSKYGWSGGDNLVSGSFWAYPRETPTMTKMCYGYATWTGAFINIVEDVNNIFKFQLDFGDEENPLIVVYELQIPTDRYSTQTFTEELTKAIENIDLTFDVSLDLDTGKVILGWDLENLGADVLLSVLWEEDTMYHELGFELSESSEGFPNETTDVVGSVTAPIPPANLNVSGIVYNADRNNGVCDAFLGWGTREFQGKKFGTFWVPKATNKIALPPTPTPTP